MTGPANRRNEKGQPGITRAALFASCPRCGEATLWATTARFAERCRACGEAFAPYELSGRWLFVPVLLVAGIAGTVALVVDSLLRPPLWLTMGLAMPLTVVAVLAAMRLAKAAVLIARLDKETR